jgi:phage terminase large subunit-like protein
MVRAVIQAARPQTPYKEVHASRGKAIRAEPISYLYPDKIKHVGYFPEIEDQLTEMTTAGYVGDRSPDRADAAIWAMTELFPQLTRKPAKKRPTRKTYASAGGWMG